MKSTTVLTYNYNQLWNNPAATLAALQHPLLALINNAQAKLLQEYLNNASPSAEKIVTKAEPEVKQEESETSTASAPKKTPKQTPKAKANKIIVKEEAGSEAKAESPKSQKCENVDYKSTKNLAKNYGSAIISFACSNLAKPYVDNLLVNEKIDYKGFLNYIKPYKGKIRSIDTFRNLLLKFDGDNEEIAAFKRLTQEIAIVFIKYFSVNWIIHSKMSNKLVYLKWRNKMLRRIQAPETFTYIKFSKEYGGRKISTVTKME